MTSALKTAAAAAVLVVAMAPQAAGQSLQRAPASAAPQTWRVLEPVSGLLAAADGQLGFPVAVRFDLLRQAAALGGTIEIPLPTGAVARATIEWTSGGDVSQTFVAGRLEGGVQGDVSLTVVGDTLAGRIVMNGRLFVVRRAPSSTLHVVTEVDPQQFPPDAEPVSPPRAPADPPAAIRDQAAQADTNQFVDLLIVYTPAARLAIGTTAAMVAEINAAVNTGNVALANAGAVHRFRLVHNAETAYAEFVPADPGTDLDRLTNSGDGFMDEVHTLRNTFGADVVSLLYVNPGTCGLAWIMGPGNVNSSFQSSAFNVVHWNCADSNLSLAHEIGHNMGLAHDRLNSSAVPSFSYAYGYAVAGAGRDVMATASCNPSCPRLAIFSTPLRNFPATATVAGVADSEDNTRALDITSVTVANFRQSAVCSYSLSATAATIGQAGGTGTVGVTAFPSTCAWTGVSNAGFIAVTGGSSGTGNGTVTYSASANSSGTRAGTLTIAGQTFTLTQGPIMTLDHTTLGFGAISTGSALSFITASQTVRVSFAGGTPFWVASATPTTPAWLQITGGGGATGNGSFTVAVVSAAGLPTTGTVTATIQVVSGGVVNTPQLVTVRLTLFAATTTTAGPFGSFDTPAAGTAQGSIAVTGWALDDIEVDRVEIWRDLTTGETTVPVNAPGHPGNGKVFIATALFVPGARPDVEAAYGTHPFAYRAGWGYLLLTWGLWNQGNGPFTLYAFAFDKEGRAVTLGTKAITASNGTAVKPFGALDTPTYGQTVTTNFWNYGWALTPRPNAADGRTCTIVNGNVSVAIDSGPLIPVTYGGARTDIPTLFPGFSNAAAAGGAYFVDIAALANGTHSIGWFVVDNCGRADGIGSRFFTVAKSSLISGLGAGDSGLGTWGSGLGVGHSLDAPHVLPHVVQDFSPAMQAATSHVVVRKTNSDWIDVPPTATGAHVLEVAQDERIEVQLPAIAGATYTGVQVVSGEQRALPLGSSLDTENGIFYWQPATGFVGGFDLEFSNLSNLVNPSNLVNAPNPVNAPNLATKLRVVVGPTLRMAIDMPQAGASVDQPLFVSGWALDLAAAEGSGIDTVHVWAYPTTGGAPIFLGVATVGDSRPDVAATYGAAFERSAYALVANRLAPGTYDVVVYAHRAASGTFEGAQVVRIVVSR